MKRTMLMTIVVLAIAAGTFAQEREIAPRVDEIAPPEVRPGARLGGTPVRDDAAGTVAVPVTIDVDGVMLDGAPVVVGGYVAVVRFDPERVTLLEVTGGADLPFTQAPYATEVGKANATGTLKVAGVQTDNVATAPLLNVARALFRETVAGGADSIVVGIESLASAIVRDAAGNPVQRPIEIDVASRVVREGAEN